MYFINKKYENVNNMNYELWNFKNKFMNVYESDNCEK